MPTPAGIWRNTGTFICFQVCPQNSGTGVSKGTCGMLVMPSSAPGPGRGPQRCAMCWRCTASTRTCNYTRPSGRACPLDPAPRVAWSHSLALLLPRAAMCCTGGLLAIPVLQAYADRMHLTHGGGVQNTSTCPWGARPSCNASARPHVPLEASSVAVLAARDLSLFNFFQMSDQKPPRKKGTFLVGPPERYLSGPPFWSPESAFW